MTQIAIVTDSTAYLAEDVREAHNISVIPLSVVFGDDAYREEIDITKNEFLDKMKHAEDLPTTSQPPIGEFIALFEELSKDYDAVITIHLSSGISGTYQTACAAAEQVSDKVEVYCFDSEISCMPQGFYAIRAAEMSEAGHTVDEILDVLNEMKKRTKAYFVVDNLNHLHRGGRLNGAQAIVGSLLQIKPVLHFEDTKIVPFEKVRTAKKAIARIYDIFAEDIKNSTSVQATVIHSNRAEKAEQMKKELSQAHPQADVVVSEFGPVIATHLGEGALALGWYSR